MATNENITLDLYTKFFNAETQFSTTLATLPEIDARIKELEMIAFEAKVRLGAVAEKKRKVVANLSAAERERLLTTKDLNVSDSLNAVKIRKARMSKADTMAADMRMMHIPEDIIQQTVSKIMPDVKPEFKDSHPIVDKRKPEAEITFSKGANTQASLLKDITDNIGDAINGRIDFPDKAYDLARTACHIARLAYPELKLSGEEANTIQPLTIEVRNISLVVEQMEQAKKESTSFNPFE